MNLEFCLKMDTHVTYSNNCKLPRRNKTRNTGFSYYRSNELKNFCFKHMCVNRSVMSNSVTPWTVAHQASLSMDFSRQEYWSGLSFPFPGDLPNPGIKPGSPTLQKDSLPPELQGSSLT